MSNKLAEELKRIRGIRSLSLRQVEKKTGISNAYLSQLERGEAHNPSPSKLHALAECYEVPYESLMASAGYLSEKSPLEKKQGLSATQAALMSADLDEAEEKMVAEYIKFIRSQRKK
ncbi:helix-turn-helix domain-containing protein [Candidatus Pacearchaeota archaeon]|nr:helix-turn-helix domain-containing protein [Candidatus Pacearchaeota archaeon]